MRFFAFLLCPLALWAQQDWRFAHPGATLIGGMRVHALLESPLVGQLIEEATKQEPSAAMMTAMAKGALSGVTEVRYSLLDTGGPEPDVLVLVSGKLDDAMVSAMLSEGKFAGQRVDANSLLLGSPASVKDAVARMAQPAAALGNRALARAAALSPNHDFWVAGSLPALPMTAGLAGTLHGLAAGLSLQSDLTVEVALDAASAEMAEQLVTQARAAEAAQPPTGAKIETAVVGSAARFRVSMPQAQLLEAIRAGVATQMFSQGGTKADPMPPPLPSKPKRTTVIIQGLEEGPREIPMPKASTPLQR